MFREIWMKLTGAPAEGEHTQVRSPEVLAAESTAQDIVAAQEAGDDAAAEEMMAPIEAEEADVTAQVDMARAAANEAAEERTGTEG